MKPLTEQAHDLVRDVVRSGETVIDATVGNGHDTTFLAMCVGPAGTVFAFDVQLAAIEKTRVRLVSAGVSNVVLVHRDHAEMDRVIPETYRRKIAAVMFNLGYLPGGERAVVTRGASTVTAVNSAIGWLRLGGLVTIIAYLGHAGGREEAVAVMAFLRGLSRDDFEVQLPTIAADSVTPVLILVRRIR